MYGREKKLTAIYIYTGIDIAKDRLDVVLRPSGEYLRLENNEGSIRRLVDRLCKVDLQNLSFSRCRATSSRRLPLR